MLLYTVIFSLLWVSVTATHADDCGSKVGNFSRVDVSGCNDDSHECILKKNTNVTLQITFTTKQVVTAVTAVVHGIVQGLPVPFPLPEPDACKSSLHCPLNAGTTYTYIAQLPIKRFYPSVQVDIEWELQDEQKVDIVCCKILARIR